MTNYDKSASRQPTPPPASQPRPRLAVAIILTDGKAGHENQSRAFARSLDLSPVLVPVSFRSRAAKALSYLLDRLGIRSLALFKPFPLPPEAASAQAVIGTGSGTFYAAKTLARRLQIPCAAILLPRGYSLASFNCILAPSFDNPPVAPNVIPVPANLVSADPQFYSSATAAFRSRHPSTPKTAVAVIIGGPNPKSTLSPAWIKSELEKIFAAHSSPDTEFWVTTSRRTPPEVEAIVDSFPFHYKLIYSRDQFNPIPAFVSTAQFLYVTAESTGMLSEACTFGSARVSALDNLLPGPHKFRRFISSLAAQGYLDGSRKIDLAPQFERARALLNLPLPPKP